MNKQPTRREALVSLNDASADYGQHAVLNAINLHLHEDEKVVLLGKSGAGKSTLLKLLYQQLVDNNETTAWIPQDHGLVAPLSVFHNIFMARLSEQSLWRNLKNLILPDASHQQAITTLIEQLQLPHCLFQSVSNLSGGQQQRIAIARALYQSSHYLLADEPVANLDKPLAKHVLNLISKHYDGFVIALHDTDLALSIADRVIAIKDGHILLDARVESINADQLAAIYSDQAN